MTNSVGTTNTNTNGLDVLALGATPSVSNSRYGSGSSSAAGGGGGSWFEALAAAWGSSLDQEAGKLESMSGGIGGGDEDPSQIAQLTAESLRMSFMSQSESTSISAAGESLQTMARKD